MFIYQRKLAEEVSISPKEKIVEELEKLGVSGKDAIHLASAYHYQEKRVVWLWF